MKSYVFFCFFLISSMANLISSGSSQDDANPQPISLTCNNKNSSKDKPDNSMRNENNAHQIESKTKSRSDSSDVVTFDFDNINLTDSSSRKNSKSEKQNSDIDDPAIRFSRKASVEIGEDSGHEQVFDSIWRKKDFNYFLLEKG